MKLKAIYQPKGRAREYAEYALNLSLGCTHGCKYCYAPKIVHKTREEFHAAAPLRPGILEKLEHDLVQLRDAGVRDQVLMCFTTDPYCTAEIAEATREAIKLFRRHDVPFTVLTKHGSRAHRDFELYSEHDSFGVTLTCVDHTTSKAIEPGAEATAWRILSLYFAHKADIRTWVSFEPVLDENATCELFLATKDDVDLFKIGKTNYGYPHNVKDWGAFGRRMVELCERYGKAYYIKKDLRDEMEKGENP